MITPYTFLSPLVCTTARILGSMQARKNQRCERGASEGDALPEQPPLGLASAGHLPQPPRQLLQEPKQALEIFKIRTERSIDNADVPSREKRDAEIATPISCNLTNRPLNLQQKLSKRDPAKIIVQDIEASALIRELHWV